VVQGPVRVAGGARACVRAPFRLAAAPGVPTLPAAQAGGGRVADGCVG